MKNCNALAALGLAVALPLAGCSGGSETSGSDTSTHSPSPASDRHFLSLSGDSDYSGAINCNAGEGSYLSVIPAAYAPNARTVTLGDTDQDVSQEVSPWNPSPNIKFLGGATMYLASGHTYDVATSDGRNIRDINLDHQKFRVIIPVEGKDFSVAVTLGLGSAGTYTSIECVPPPISRVLSPQTQV
jgi:hypothetical protein